MTWPDANLYDVLKSGGLDQLENMLAYLPAAQTVDQVCFIEVLIAKIDLMRKNEEK